MSLPKKSIVAPPEWLTNKWAREAWTSLLPLGFGGREWSSTTHSVLAVYCALYGDIAEASLARAEISLAKLSTFRALANELGLTPMSRAEMGRQ